MIVELGSDTVVKLPMAGLDQPVLFVCDACALEPNHRAGLGNRQFHFLVDTLHSHLHSSTCAVLWQTE